MTLFLFALLRGCAFLSDQKGTKESPGAGSEECQHSSRLPPDPVTGDASRESFLEPGAGGAADCPRFPAAAAGWAIRGKLGKLDGESAPGASSRRGWYVIGGRRNAAPTQGSGPGCRGGLWPPAVYCPAKPYDTSQADPLGRRNISPTPSRWIFAGGWYPPLQKTGETIKNVGATGWPLPPVCVQNGRRGETKFRRKFFCLLFFQEK